VAETPSGPFIDGGRRLTSEQFAIDPHVFQDDDGARYMFYATDFLHHSHIGTGTVVDRMVDPYTLSGRARPVTRARYEWQVYDPNRIEKGGVRWYTVEGPFVLKRDGLYYQMFSGGNWKTMTYGVSYAVTDDIESTDEWSQYCDGERVLPILRTIPGKVIGPGHNSVVRGPDNRELFCVYHRWDEESRARVLCIDRQDWDGDRIVVLGPSTTPQPAPSKPAVDGFDGDGWEFAGGCWSARGSVAAQEYSGPTAEARCRVGFSSFIMEASLRSLLADSEKGHIGVTVIGGREDALRFALMIPERKAVASWLTPEGWAERRFDLPEVFRMDAYHLLRIEVDNGFARIALDGATARWAGRIFVEPQGIALVTADSPAEFRGFALTPAFGIISRQ
ncbi:MAG TPA: family 43 glycosylhydrolase, partial [Blastocatellia bacterium]|nr:family 43 glycosylhydrolase [Blastocatellia bacterium]